METVSKVTRYVAIDIQLSLCEERMHGVGFTRGSIKLGLATHAPAPTNYRHGVVHLNIALLLTCVLIIWSKYILSALDLNNIILPTMYSNKVQAVIDKDDL